MPSSTKQINWRELVREADPKFDEKKREDPGYEFTGGRRFQSPQDPYRA